MNGGFSRWGSPPLRLPFDFAQGFGKAGQALCGFQRMDTSNLELESDGFEETQARSGSWYPTLASAKPETRMGQPQSVPVPEKVGRPASRQSNYALCQSNYALLCCKLVVSPTNLMMR